MNGRASGIGKRRRLPTCQLPTLSWMLQLHEYRSLIYSLTLDAVPSVQASIQRGLAALDKALQDKTTVHRAMYREGLGWVDFVWGEDGRWPPGASGNRKGAKGVAHVLEARPRKDGMSHRQTVQLLRRMVYAIAEGEEKDRVTFGNVARVIVGKDGTEVHLVKRPGSNAWMLTIFETNA